MFHRCLPIFLFTALIVPGSGKPSPSDVERLIRQLGSDNFAAREAASKSLEAIGKPALAALRMAAREGEDAEVRRRAEGLVEAVEARLYREVRCYTGHGDAVLAVRFSPGGRHIISGGVDKTVQVHDIETGTVQIIFRGHSSDVTGVALSADGLRAMSSDVMGKLVVWNCTTGKEVWSSTGHQNEGFTYGVAISDDGQRALSAGGVTVRCWNMENGKQLQCLHGHQGMVLSATFTHDGGRVVSGGLDTTLRLWDLQTTTEVRRFAGPSGSVWGIAVSSDNRKVLSSGDDETVRVWDLDTGKQLHCLKGHVGRVCTVAISPDGHRAVSGGMDGTVRLWDIETGKQLYCFNGHEEVVWSVAFSPDGKRAVSGSRDKTVRLWQVGE